jgi:hypothetical protein
VPLTDPVNPLEILPTASVCKKDIPSPDKLVAFRENAAIAPDVSIVARATTVAVAVDVYKSLATYSPMANEPATRLVCGVITFCFVLSAADTPHGEATSSIL